MSGDLLLERTLNLVVNRPRAMTYLVLADMVNSVLPDGESITPGWLEQFATRRIRRPDVTKVQRIYEALNGAALFQ